MTYFETYDNEDDARHFMRAANRSRTERNGSPDITVMVDGPDDGEFSLMTLESAIGAGFTYTWDTGR